MLDEPVVDRVEVAHRQREMSVVVGELRPHAGNVARQPLPLHERDEAILAAVVEERGSPDVTELKAPRRQERQLVVPPAIRAGGQA